MTVPCSLTHIGNYAIYKCSSVVINYNDIYEEWLKVVIGDGNYAYRINHKLLGENAEYLVYEHYLDGINITGLSYNINENVEIPRIIQGKPVTHIGMNAFYDSNITDIFIPDSVTAIGDYAFYWTTKQEATCQHEKIEYRECLHCSEKEYLYGEKTEHNYMLVASKDATISETGYVTYSCSWCELTYTDTIPVLEKLCCDVNCDGEIRINDLILLISHLNFSTALTEHGAYNADISGDGKIRMNDLIMLLNFLSSNEQI